MRSRADFLRAQRQGARASKPALGLEVFLTNGEIAQSSAARVGFTASRKVGGAVERNRAKRRMRAAAAAILPLYGRERHDYVLVARTATLSRPFALLLDDLIRSLSAAHAALDRKSTKN